MRPTQLAIGLLFTCFALQGQALAETPTPPASLPAIALPETPLAANLPISRIDFAGDVIKEGALRRLLTFKPGSLYSPVDVRQTLDAFYQMGLFDGIAVEKTPTATGLVVTFRFKLRVFITGWRFEGNQHLDAGTLARAVDLSWGQPLNQAQFETFQQAIQTAYQREGYLHARARFGVEALAPGRARLVIRVDEGPPLVISKLKFLSTGPLSESEVIKALGLHARDTLRQTPLLEGLDRVEQALSGTGYLNSRLNYTFELPDESRVSDYFSLIAKQPSSVNLILGIETGQKAVVSVDTDVALSAKELASAITVYKNRSYSPYELDANDKKLQALYVSKGYPDAVVSHDVEKRPDESYSIVFKVDAGERISVAAVNFTGNKAFASDTLRHMLNTQPSRFFFGGGVYDPSVWNQDLARLLAFYAQNGYQEMAITSVDSHIDHAHGRLTLVVHIKEGPQTRISRMIFKGASPVQEAGLLQTLPGIVGSPYNPRSFNEYLASVQAYYARVGYPLAKADATFQPGPLSNAGTLVFTIQPGPRKRLGAVIYRGNLITHGKVIERQLTIKGGDWYNSEEILHTQEQIYQLGFFDRVNIGPLHPISTDSRDPVDLVLDLHERETGSIGVGGGFGTLEGPQADVEYQETNLGGTGRPLRLEGTYSNVKSSASISLQEPYLLSQPIIGLGGLSYLLDNSKSGLSVETYGPTLSLSKQLTSALLGTLRYSFLHTNYRLYTPQDLIQAGGLTSRNDGIITPDLTYDTRSDLVNPRFGTKAELSVDLASRLLGGTLSYTRPHFTVAHYIPLQGRWVFALGGEIGYIQTLSGQSLPYDVLFLAGGANSIRGYAYNQVGVPGISPSGIVGGQALLVTHAEFRFPLFGDLGGVVFTDAGNVWSNLSAVGWSDIKLTAGAGLRYDTPVGPVRFDYGFLLRPQLGLGTYYFGLGQAF